MTDKRFRKTIKSNIRGEITRHNLIIDFLRSSGESTFGEVNKELINKGVPYAKRNGLDLALKSLMKKDRINKKQKSKNNYPVYYLKKTELDNLILEAQEFQRGVIWKISEFPKLPLGDSESNEEYLIKNLIHMYGLYNLYVQMKSWKDTSKHKSHSENFDIRSTFLKHTLPMGKESYLLEEGIRDLCDLNFYNNSKEFDESISEIYQNSKKQKKLIELEELLKKKYPDETKFLERIMKKSPDESKKTKEWIREVQDHNAWKKRISRKNLKNPKKTLKLNQCPVCYYDGTTKVKAGQCKGMIFPAGYVNEFTNNEGEHWHCPACGHWETKMIV